MYIDCPSSLDFFTGSTSRIYRVVECAAFWTSMMRTSTKRSSTEVRCLSGVSNNAPTHPMFVRSLSLCLLALVFPKLCGDIVRLQVVITVQSGRVRSSSQLASSGRLLIGFRRQEPHPNLGQVLGRSHPSVEKPFYVLESGDSSV